MNWVVLENKEAIKAFNSAPIHVQSKYSYWKKVVINNGVNKLSQIRGFNFEKLKGNRMGQFSCRLSKGYRIIFEIRSKEFYVLVLEMNKHEY